MDDIQSMYLTSVPGISTGISGWLVMYSASQGLDVALDQR
jgi:hypothetical protein